MTLFKKCQTFFHQIFIRFYSAMATLSLKNMSLLEQLARKISCWSAGVLLNTWFQVFFNKPVNGRSRRPLKTQKQQMYFKASRISFEYILNITLSKKSNAGSLVLKVFCFYSNQKTFYDSTVLL